MAYGTIIQQGHFVSTGQPQILNIVSDVDWLECYNWTNFAAGIVASTGLNYYWQRSMPYNDGLVWGYNAVPAWVGGNCNGLGALGFALIDTSVSQLGASTGVVTGTNAVHPIFTVANTGVLTAGSIVRIYNSAMTNLNGLDFTVDTVVPGGPTFRLANALQQAPGVAAGVSTYRMVAPSLTIYQNYYPKKRVIANITQGTPAGMPGQNVVTTLVDHGYTTGQFVRMLIPAVCGMTELNEQLVTVTVINAGSFSMNVDTTNYTAFVFPLPAATPFTPAEVIPVGEDSVVAPNVLDDAMRDLNFRGIQLAASVAGVNLYSPAGIAGDLIYWKAGKSENV